MKKKLMIAAAVCLLAGCGKQDQGSSGSGIACRYVNYYDYSLPVPETEAADNTYFEKTFFAGDSRMGSLFLYSDLKDSGAEIHYAESLSLWRIYDMKAEDTDASLYDLMLKTDRKYLYILIGINEVRSKDFSSWKKEAGSLIDEIREKHPGIVIYLMQSYRPRNITGLEGDQIKTQVDLLNQAIAELAAEKHVYFMNPESALMDDTGAVRSDYVWDGLHLNVDGTKAFSEYIRTHAAKEEEYVKEICD
ncbi:MAG: hypothetical protein K6A40_07830 [Solobacterium sp.]|nr:hypothetical protein [Solobacterium sp.]